MMPRLRQRPTGMLVSRGVLMTKRFPDGAPGARCLLRARQSPIPLPPPLAEQDGQDRGSRRFFMTHDSRSWLAESRTKKSTLAGAQVFFEAGAPYYDGTPPRTERAHPRRAHGAIGGTCIKSCLQRNM